MGLSFDDFFALPFDVILVVIYHFEVMNCDILLRKLTFFGIRNAAFRFNMSEDLERWEHISIAAEVTHRIQMLSGYLNHVYSFSSKLNSSVWRFQSKYPVHISVNFTLMIVLI